MKRLAFFLVAFVVAMTGAEPAAAAPESEAADVARAREVEAEARAAFAKKDHERAAALFAKAHAIAPSAATKYNEAFAWSTAGRPAEAADAYDAALALGLEGKLAEASRERLATLRAELGRLEVRAPKGAQMSVAHARERLVPATVHLEPGSHELTLVHPDGTRTEHTVAAEAGVATVLELASPDPETPAPAPAPAPPPPPEESSALPVAGYVLLGLGGAGAVAMAVTGALTLGAADDYEASGHRDADLRAEAATLRTTTNALIGISAGLAAAGVVLVVIGLTGEDDSDAALSIGPGRAAVRLRF